MNLYKAGLGLVALNVLGDSFVKGVCKHGESHEHCRYFSKDESGPICLKLTPFRQEIDEEVELFLREVAYNGNGLPVGDNCAGCPPPLSLLLN